MLHVSSRGKLVLLTPEEEIVIQCLSTLLCGKPGRTRSIFCHLAGLIARPPMRRRNELSVNVQGCLNAGMSHLSLNILGVCTCLDHPCRSGSSQAAPVHKANADLPSGRLDESSKDIVVAHRLPLFRALKNQIVSGVICGLCRLPFLLSRPLL